MEKVYLFGLTVADMKDSILTIRNKALVYFCLKMEDAMKDNGKMVNSMVKVFFARKIQADKVFGCKANEFNGLMKENKMRLDLYLVKMVFFPFILLKIESII